MCILSTSLHFTSHFSSVFPGWALQQSPDTVVRVGDPVTLECSASGKNFVNMYWYKLPMEKDAGMQLIIFATEGSKGDIEKEFKNRFQSNGTKNNRLSVKIDHALLNDSGTYFCAGTAQTFPALYFTVPHFLHLPSSSSGKTWNVCLLYSNALLLWTSLQNSTLAPLLFLPAVV
uniref:Ig-like domain-containing protein n=1 Tax=Malurus cyaneus samueli TaxID=2593467 RepID=A0A8C5TC24_9PASS